MTRFVLVAAFFGLALGASPEDDAISAWILHFDPRLGAESIPTYRELLEKIPAATPVVVAVQDDHDAETFRALLADDGARTRLAFLRAGVPVTAWARDRYIVFRRRGVECVLLPDADRVQEGADGDLAVARGLADLRPGLRIIESGLSLEGGNVLVTRTHVLVAGSAIADNGGSREEFEERLAAVFGRRPLVVGGADDLFPHEHIDMYVSVAGRGRVVVGDPPPDVEDGLEHARWKPIYDRIAVRLGGAGFQVFRVPIVHAADGLITWNNVVTERRRGRDIVYLPRYGRTRLDRAAAACWRRLAYDVRTVDARGVIRHGGAIRCVSNVLRGPAR